MDKKHLLELIKENSKINSIRLPRFIDFNLNKGVLELKISSNNLLKNMQEDGSTFEGWSLVLKRWIHEIDKINLKWDKLDVSVLKGAKEQHYQRFLYRVSKFSQNYNWFSIDNDNKSCLGELKIIAGKKLILNSPSEERNRQTTGKKALNEFSEGELETFIVSDKIVSNKFKSIFNLKILDNQLPVGVFENTISNNTKILTGGKSAIDIWGITNNNEVSIFELKDFDNKKIGALSELFLYSNIIQDVVDGILKHTSFEHLGIEDIKNAKQVNCYLLAPNTHPLIDSGVFELLNSSISKIKFMNVKIEETFDFIKL